MALDTEIWNMDFSVFFAEYKNTNDSNNINNAADSQGHDHIKGQYLSLSLSFTSVFSLTLWLSSGSNFKI